MGKLLTFSIFLLLAGLALLVYVQLDAPVARVAINGQLDDGERRQIQSAVGRSVDGGLLSADLDALKAGILDLSWPRTVSIRRVWPDTLEISVEKPMVVARWQDAYLASDGSIVNLPGVRLDLPRFDCSISEPRIAMEMFHRLNEASATQGLTIADLSENGLGEWALTLHDQLVSPGKLADHGRAETAADKAEDDKSGDAVLLVLLGAESVVERLERFLIVYRAHLSARLNEIAQVDARYDNGVAVSWLDAERDSTAMAMASASATATAERKGNQL